MIIGILKTMLLFWGSITISNGDLFVSDSETFYIDFTNIDEFNPPKEGALIKIEKKMIVVRTFFNNSLSCQKINKLINQYRKAYA